MASNQKALTATFDRIAPDYEQHAALATEAGRRLLERLDGLRFEPRRIVEVGCADGRHCLALREQFPGASIVGLDLSGGMLRLARRRRGRWRRRFELLRADAAALPLADDSADFVFANLTLAWCDEPSAVLESARRVLRPGGLFLGSVFGPDTLAETKPQTALNLPTRADVQALGSLLVSAGFREPVLDTDWIQTTYSSTDSLTAELRGLGMLGMDGASLEQGTTALTWEIVSASAWAPEPGQPVRSGQGEEISIPVEQIRRRRR